MRSKQVFIPSRGRWDRARKLTKIWHDKGFDVNWVVEPDEHDKYWDAITTGGPIGPPPEDPLHCKTFVLPLEKSNQGVSYARAQCVRIADDWDFESIILADDDIKPSTRRPDGMADILEACTHPKILGMTARYSYHDLCLGPRIKTWDDIILLPTGTFRLVGLNVQNVLSLGNYDTDLEYAEDCDLFLRSLEAGFPWMVHLGSFANSMGTRYEPGGMLDFAGGWDELAEKKAKWHNTLHDQYPNLVNKHTKKCYNPDGTPKQNCIIISWQRAYDHYLPGWRKWSELHGGDLQEYIDA